ncbi:MAG: PAS domain S-box protein [Desulfobacterales bacterium]|nr:PAS domain S-box protein [Desulfobacterales bacterium]
MEPVKIRAPSNLAGIFAVLAGAVFVAGLLVCWWVGRSEKERMRSDLLRQAQMIADSVNDDWLERLTGTPQDETSPAYLRVKEQLGLICSTNPLCRLIYISGLRDDGQVVFYVDSEPPETENYSAPGTTHEGASEEFRRVLSTGAGWVEGPSGDRWGAWVSALTPLRPKQLGAPPTLLGIDVGAREWVEHSAAVRAPYLAMTLVLTAVLGFFCFYLRRSEQAQRRLAESERRLAESEKAYRGAVMNMLDVFYRVDAEGILRMVSPSAAEVFGYASVEDLLGRPADILWAHPENRPKLLAVLEQAGEVLDWEFEARRRDGGTLAMAVSLHALRDGTGRLSGYEGVARDITERRQAEIKLRQSERRFRAVLENMSLIGVMLDRDGGILLCNDFLLELTGWSRPEVLGGNWFDLFLPEDVRASALNVFRQTVETGVFPVHSRSEIATRDGRRRTIGWNNTVLRSDEGRVENVTIIGEDITERLRAEEELRLDDMRLEALLQLNQMTDTGIQEITSFTLEQAVRLTGSRIGYLAFASEDESVLTMHAWSSAAMAECRMKEMPRVYRVSETGLWGEPVRQRRPIITNSYDGPHPGKKGCPEGHVHVVRHLGVPVMDGGRIVIVAGVGNKESGYDESDVRQLNLLMSGMWRILQRKRAEEALKESEGRFRTAFENASVGMALVNSDGVYLEVNAALARMMGYTPADMVGRPVAGFTHPEDRGRRSQFIESLVAGRIASGEQERRFIHQDGSTVWTRIWASVQRDPEGRFLNFISLVQDITAAKKTDADNRSLQSRLLQAQKMEAIGSLAGGIAHDFNNILSAIIGFTELSMLSENAPVEYLQEAMKAANRARDLVKQILSFSRQGGEERMPVHVGMVVKEAVKFLRASLPATIEIRSRVEGSASAVMSNSVELHQILINLATNGAHAIGEQGGAVDIDARGVSVQAGRRGVPPDLAPGAYVQVSVRDTGCGIAPEIRERIFDPYFTTKDKGVGTGLGLAVVHGIVKKAGGAIHVESEVGKGSAFHVYLPKVEWASAASTERVGLPSGGTERILFVDDEPMLVEIGEKILRRLGYEVVSRTSPLEALELFRARPESFDLVVTDQTMPGLTGDALAAEIMKVRPGIPVVLCTGYSQTVNEERARGKGIKALVLKPLLINQIDEAIRKALQA